MESFSQWWDTQIPADHLSPADRMMYMNMAMRGWDAMFRELNPELSQKDKRIAELENALKASVDCEGCTGHCSECNVWHIRAEALQGERPKERLSTK